MLLGCIGDDFTGSGDLANTLTRQGMRVVQYCGIPEGAAEPGVDAGVIALKSRSMPAEEAVRQAIRALEWLRAQGCEQFVFKYCSTFDSTPEGNIGPVADALAEALDASPVIVCPALPASGRTVYQGHLFVRDTLLSESGMQNHPLTPMTDPDIRRWLRRQSRAAVGHVPLELVLKGADAIRRALEAEALAGRRHVVIDATRDEDLREIGRAASHLRLVTGGSGVALGLPANFGFVPRAAHWGYHPGKSIALSGSCSQATRDQIADHAAAGNPVFEISVPDLIEGRLGAQDILDWLMASEGLPLAYTSANPESVASTQARYGREVAAMAVEQCFAEIARRAVARDVRRIVTAGGETSGAVVEGLGISALAIGPEIDAGVPALRVSDGLVLALKSGNFGGRDFFERADRVLRGAE
ncbi:MAG TPA: 3-oxo-tetronate kinase [Devosiaceae bacterium]